MAPGGVQAPQRSRVSSSTVGEQTVRRLPSVCATVDGARLGGGFCAGFLRLHGGPEKVLVLDPGSNCRAMVLEAASAQSGLVGDLPFVSSPVGGTRSSGKPVREG